MKPLAKICFGLLLGAFAHNLEARFVTLLFNTQAPSIIIRTNSITIGSNEVAQIVSWEGSFFTTFTRDGITNWVTTSSAATTIIDHPVIFAGPATITIYAQATNYSYGFLTLKIDAAEFPPDKTLIVPQGSGARIVLESSTNLTHWVEAPPGSYTNVSVNMFFRIRADRIP